MAERMGECEEVVKGGKRVATRAAMRAVWKVMRKVDTMVVSMVAMRAVSMEFEKVEHSVV
jgi:hypothetical protein